MSSRDEPEPKPKGVWRYLGPTLALAAAAAVLGFCIWAAVSTWKSAAQANPTSHFTAHGWAALIIAFVMVIVVGGGLMWLAFYSARKGYDDRVGGTEE